MMLLAVMNRIPLRSCQPFPVGFFFYIKTNAGINLALFYHIPLHRFADHNNKYLWRDVQLQIVEPPPFFIQILVR
jgi:hypothetical protein